MKVAILAGGLGTRIQEETQIRPKPMIEIGGRPILWHIMKIFSSYGFSEFILALGYKSEIIKDYFINYHHYSKNLTILVKEGRIIVHNGSCEDWTIHLLDTGISTQTGGRVKQIADFIGDEPFFLTYGDGVSDINITSLLHFHNTHKTIATVTAVHPPARFGRVLLGGDLVIEFEEKNQTNEGWINGGFFIFEPDIRNYITGDNTVLEREPLEQLAKQGQLSAYRHEGFWQCMDTLRDLRLLEEMVQSGNALWVTWE